MSFRSKLVIIILLTVSVSVGLVAWQVSTNARKSFDQLDAERNAAFLAQFQRELQRRDQETKRQIESILSSETVLRMALEASRPAPDFSAYLNTAQEQASAHQLELLEFVSPDGTIISSAQWPARFGYKEMWLLDYATPKSQSAFLKNEELPDGNALGYVAVGPLRVHESNLYVVGGHQLGADFLKSLSLPAGMRVLLYRVDRGGFNPRNLLSADAALPSSDKFEHLIRRVEDAQRQHRSDSVDIAEDISWSDDAANSETFNTMPLFDRQNELLGVLLVGSSHRARVEMARHIRGVAFLIGGAGVIFGLLLSTVLAGRITKPIEQLAAAAGKVAHGDWETLVDVSSVDEIGKLATAFNHMTEQLLSQREQLIQTERVAAWRELARRLAHELKNPLFPLQITVENLLRAREHSAKEFDEVFRESTATLLAEISNLKAIIGRFSDFSKMPAPQWQQVDLNEIVRGVAALFQVQFSRDGGPQIAAEYQLSPELSSISADPVLLRRALENLVLNALDAMPNGGKLRFRTSVMDNAVLFELQDSGGGLSPEECDRLFTPYYTTKQYGTGLGLAIVQSVVSDHHGRVWVTSQKNQGSTFHIELPLRHSGETEQVTSASDNALQAKSN